jgi:hypothetical protein
MSCISSHRTVAEIGKACVLQLWPSSCMQSRQKGFGRRWKEWCMASCDLLVIYYTIAQGVHGGPARALAARASCVCALLLAMRGCVRRVAWTV